MQAKPLSLSDKARILESYGMNEAEIAAAIGRRVSYVRLCLLRDSPQTSRSGRNPNHDERGRFAHKPSF